MDNLKYFPFYYARFADGVRGYSMEFIGCYMMLLCRQAELQRIPKDLQKLSRWMGGVELGLIEEVLKEKFLEDDNGFYNVTLESVLKEVANKSESARKSANERWERMRNKCERNANASETHQKTDANDMLIKESKVNEIKEKENILKSGNFFEKSINDEGWHETLMRTCKISNPVHWITEFNDHSKSTEEHYNLISDWRRHCVNWIKKELRLIEKRKKDGTSKQTADERLQAYRDYISNG